MKDKRQKAFWEKRVERFPDGTAAHSRAGRLRSQPSVSHVKVTKTADAYEVSYSVAQWYVEEMRKAGVTL